MTGPEGDGADARARDAPVPPGWLVGAAGLLLLLVWAGIRGGAFAGVDGGLLRAMRVAGHPDLPGGPHWLERLMRDVTVLGGGRILTLTVIVAAGLFAVRRRHAAALLLVAGSYAGSLLVSVLKALVGRTRPDIVPHLVQESSASFPSAHAANSAIIFLTIAAFAVRHEAHRGTRRAVMAAGIGLTLLIGVSRLYLGVHWPTDVLAGWCVGVGWAALMLMAARRLDGQAVTAARPRVR